ncbi:predicted protein [Histoplasma mississippiense (nom. inval.)]|uniref:predicted protein n=1 Tax=Ajellomyces capsulatus (strain NAm1 / WU24) TaxID=2059318 RepID=UPI000157D4B4|nr:predicted protein [Histoplasma mississippiense (nom. inval.)]EDN05087.1 predicted protein [Histoplasma mississippiense (nom. inval.)]
MDSWAATARMAVILLARNRHTQASSTDQKGVVRSSSLDELDGLDGNVWVRLFERWGFRVSLQLWPAFIACHDDAEGCERHFGGVL